MAGPTGDPLRSEVRLTRVLAQLAGAWVVLGLAFLVPILNPAVSPNLDLSHWFAQAAYGVTQSAGVPGATILALAVVLLILSRPGLSTRRMRVEAPTMMAALGLFLGGGAWINEHVIKPGVGSVRPSIAEIANAEVRGSNAGLSATEIYALPDARSRSAYLRSLSTDTAIAGIRMAPSIREHWIRETGYALPSGHTFAAMLIATFALVMGADRLRGWRAGAPYLLLSWAVLVGYSRTLLRVHSPLDVLVGGIEGGAVGLATAALVRWLATRP